MENLREYNEILNELTNELLIEKTNNPEAEIVRDGRSVRNFEIWLGDQIQDDDFIDEFVGWYLQKNDKKLETYYANEEEICDETYVGTRADWEQYLAYQKIETPFDDLIEENSIRKLY